MALRQKKFDLILTPDFEDKIIAKYGGTLPLSVDFSSVEKDVKVGEKLVRMTETTIAISGLESSKILYQRIVPTIVPERKPYDYRFRVSNKLEEYSDQEEIRMASTLLKMIHSKWRYDVKFFNPEDYDRLLRFSLQTLIQNINTVIAMKQNKLSNKELV